MNKLMMTLIFMVGFAFSAFATGFNDDVSVSEPVQFFVDVDVDVGSGASTMFTVAKKSMLIKNVVALNTHAKAKAKSDTVLPIGVKLAEGTDGYFAYMSQFKRLSG